MFHGYMIFLTFKHLDILLIFICFDGLLTILGPQNRSKFDVGSYIHNWPITLHCPDILYIWLHLCSGVQCCPWALFWFVWVQLGGWVFVDRITVTFLLLLFIFYFKLCKINVKFWLFHVFHKLLGHLSHSCDLLQLVLSVIL